MFKCLTLNHITKGWIYNLPLLKYIVPYLAYEIVTPSGVYYGGGTYDDMMYDVRRRKDEDITLIKVYIDWSKYRTKKKKITVELLTKQITASLITELGEKGKDVKIEIISESNIVNKPKISASLIEPED